MYVYVYIQVFFITVVAVFYVYLYIFQQYMKTIIFAVYIFNIFSRNQPRGLIFGKSGRKILGDANFGVKEFTVKIFFNNRLMIETVQQSGPQQHFLIGEDDNIVQVFYTTLIVFYTILHKSLFIFHFA